MDWNIQSRARSCQGCDKDFADREPVHTLLFSDPEGYERVDVCADCWRGQYADGANHRRGFISHWQTTHVIPPKTPEPIQRESAETLLRKLIELNDPGYTGACFVLAVMLERKRILKTQARSTDNGRRIIHYEHAKSGDLFSVVDPALQLDQLEAVQRQVSGLLEHGLPGPATTGETANVGAEEAESGEVSTETTQARDAAADEGTTEDETKDPPATPSAASPETP